MSLILEALNRARREQHNAAPVPGVDSEHYFPSASAANLWRQRGLLAALALSLLVIGVLLGREFSRDGAELPAAAREPETVVAQTPPPQAALPQAAAPSIAASSTAAAPEPTVEEVQEAEEAPEAEATVVAAPALPASPAQPTLPETAGTGISAEVAALYQQPTAPEVAPEPVTATAPAPAPAGTNEEAVDIASLVTAAEQALEDVRLAEHSAPLLGDLSQQRKDAVPTLMYLQHDYRTEGGSTVTINGQSARAGQTVGRGVKVEEILPDSVVLSHDGEQFRLRALNSWVNL